VTKIQQLKMLVLDDSNAKITKAGMAKLQKVLPKCKIYSNPTK